MAIEKITELPEPLTELECLLYYIATGQVPTCMIDRPTNKVQAYMRYIAENGIAAGGGKAVVIRELQAAGKRRMASADFLNGMKDIESCRAE